MKKINRITTHKTQTELMGSLGQTSNAASSFQKDSPSNKTKPSTDETKTPSKNADDVLSVSKPINKGKNLYLNIIATRKIINRFLIEKKMSMEKLAEVLGTDTRSLNQILSTKTTAASELMSKINLPLIKLYCATKWNSS